MVGAVFVGGDAGQFLGALGEGAVDVRAEGLLQAPVDGDVLQALLLGCGYLTGADVGVGFSCEGCGYAGDAAEADGC